MGEASASQQVDIPPAPLMGVTPSMPAVAGATAGLKDAKGVDSSEDALSQAYACSGGDLAISVPVRPTQAWDRAARRLLQVLWRSSPERREAMGMDCHGFVPLAAAVAGARLHFGFLSGKVVPWMESQRSIGTEFQHGNVLCVCAL